MHGHIILRNITNLNLIEILNMYFRLMSNILILAGTPQIKYFSLVICHISNLLNTN